MKRIIFSLLLIIFITPKTFAQYKFGDIKVKSLQEIFNPKNAMLWGKKKRGGLYPFNDKNSKIWINQPFMSVLIVDNKYMKQNTATFVANPKYVSSVIYRKLDNQLSTQFGKSKELEFHSPTNGAEDKALWWTHKEGGKIYRIGLGKEGALTVLVFYQLEEHVPNF